MRCKEKNKTWIFRTGADDYTDFGLMIANCGKFAAEIINDLRKAINSNSNSCPQRGRAYGRRPQPKR
jgi:hypothetical protein